MFFPNGVIKEGQFELNVYKGPREMTTPHQNQ